MRKRPLYGRQLRESVRKPITRPQHLRESVDEGYTESEVMDFIKKFTNDFTKEDGSIRTGYESEKNFARKILRDAYKYVSVSDGRMSKGEDMSWVISFSEPKMLKEGVDWSHDRDWSGKDNQDPEKLSKEDKKLFKDAYTQLYDALTGARNVQAGKASAKERFTYDDIKVSPYHDVAVIIETSRPTVEMTPERAAFVDRLAQKFNAVKRTLRNGDTELILEGYRRKPHNALREGAYRRKMTEAKTYGLDPSRQKSYYNKAHVIEDDNGNTYLQSYDTIVCSVDDNGRFHRHWDGASSTTMKHINDFRRLFNLPAISVGEWRKLPVDRR